MSNKAKLVVVLADLYALLVVLFGAVAAALWADMDPQEQEATLAILQNHYGIAVLVILTWSVIIGFIVQVLYRAYVLAPLRLREQALVMLNANPRLRLQAMGAPEIKALAEVVNALAEQRDSLKNDVEEKVKEAKASVEEEKNRLAALMSELSQSVVVCNLDGRILLYNNRARLQFQAVGEGIQFSSGRALIGLGRSIFAILDPNLITHALDNIRHRLRRGSAQPVANFVTTSQTDQLIRVQMAPVLGRLRTEVGKEGSEPLLDGYVLILDNITRSFELESQRDQMLQSLTEGSRASLANVRAAVENLLSYPDMETEQRDRFVGIIRDEVSVMGRQLDRTVTEFADALKTRWPLEDMLGVDLVQAARRRIEQKLGIPTKTEEVAEGLWVRVDSFALLQGLTYLVFRLRDEYKIRELRLRLAAERRLAHFDVIWSGTDIDSQTLHTWEIVPMNAGGEVSPLTLREVIERHSGEIWFEREEASDRSLFRLLIPAAPPQEALEPSILLGRESRPEYYDFDLFRQTEESRALDDQLLTELTFTVFDTETTGLQPSAGDEIIQIGATRIVNGRLLRNETFEQLVDPRRPLVRESVQIHGITEDLLRGQPTIDKVLPFFRRFCEETVLVGHNVAFDMRFLQMKEEATGVQFRQPVLDTLLLSAVIHPNQESHQLEAIAERLGVHVVGRHTALGDAFVTGEVFLKMIPLLAEQGIHTLRQAREAAERTYYARVKY
ncbi:MAG TPA: exonuclease domain-containing protein [Propionibacteriaceae bacterium]|nr:exonuclease domain-containing protein [Propionibacteriaceae bacterium]